MKKISKRDVLKGAGLLSLGMAIGPLRVLAMPLVGRYRFGKTSASMTRFVVEIPKILSYRTLNLKNNNRLVIDFETGLDLNMSGAKPLGAVKGVRMGRLDSQYFRMVLDLDYPVALQKAFVLPPLGGSGHRMVFDLKKTSQSSFNKKIDQFAYTKHDGSVKITPISSKKSSPKVVQTVAKRKKDTPIIVLDPGHGGKDPGAIGKAKTREKDIVLNVGKKLRTILKKKGYKVYMTRASDRYLKLRERSRIAENKKADLFLSIHADSNPSPKAKGFSVYTLSEKASDIESKRLAERENAADLIGITSFDNYTKDVRSILTDMAQTMSVEEGIILASLLVDQVNRTKGIASLRKTHRSAPFAVLKSTVPSALAELGFLSNRAEEKMLKKSHYQTRLAQTIADAIDKYPFS